MSGLSEENANTASSEVDSIMFLGRLDMVQHVSDASKERCFEISENAYVTPTPTFHPHQKSPGFHVGDVRGCPSFNVTFNHAEQRYLHFWQKGLN